MSVVASGLELVGVPVVGHTTPTESTILWAAKGASTSWVEYGETANLGIRVDHDEDGLRSYEDVMHRVTLSGLKPGTRYFYRAHTRAIDFKNVYSIIPGEMLVSEIGSFTTFDPDASETSFIIWNDAHGDKETILGLHQLSAQTPHDFLLFNGDVSDYVDDEAEMVGLYVNPHGQPFAQNAPLLFARGNHDVRGRAARNLSRYVSVPDGRFYYSFRQGPMAAIVLDTGEDKPDENPIFGGLNSFAAYRTRQSRWLEQEIQKPEFYLAPFRILFCHIPLWCKDGDEDNACHDGLAKWHVLLEKANFQAIVSGHTHESVVLPPTGAHSYYQIIGGGPRVDTATVIHAHATRQQMAFTIMNLDGKKLNEIVLKASHRKSEFVPVDALAAAVDMPSGGSAARPVQVTEFEGYRCDTIDAVDRAAIPECERGARRFTIGMVADGDFDSLHSTVQALRLYHPEIADQTEILVIDNDPCGPYAETLKSLEDSIPGYRYVPNTGIKGVATRDLVFLEARGQFVMCVDCDVLIAPGSVKRLYDYFDAHPDSNDLLQGPLLYDDMKTMATHLSPEWGAGIYGQSVTVPVDDGPGIDSEPFEIPMQHLGLFACRRAAWPGSNPVFRGFGCEEGYIHEKVRKRGGRTICLPFLRRLQRSNRPPEECIHGNWDDRIWNYIVGRRELDMSTKDVREHFVEFLGASETGHIIERVEAGLPSAYRLDVNPYNGELRLHHGSGDVFASIWDSASLDQQRHLLHRLCDVARRLDIKLYLYWGSLLGHIREGGIIPWDDDVDLALFDSADLPRLIQALKTEELQVWDMKSHVKICDRSYQRTSRLQYTWPAVDIFSYSLDPDDIVQEARASNQPPHYVLPQREIVLPGRPTEFEGAGLWQPERPLDILDKHYQGWREFEETTSWSHIKEGPFRQCFRRPIVTDTDGRKVAVAHGPPASAGF